MIIEGLHYDENCLCKSCKLAGNRKYIGGGVYNINKSNTMILKQWEERFDEEFASKDPEFADCFADVGSIINTTEVKQFISSLLTQAVQEEREKIISKCEQYKSYYNKIDDERNTGKHLAMDDLISLLNKQ